MLRMYLAPSSLPAPFVLDWDKADRSIVDLAVLDLRARSIDPLVLPAPQNLLKEDEEREDGRERDPEPGTLHDYSDDQPGAGRAAQPAPAEMPDGAAQASAARPWQRRPHVRAHARWLPGAPRRQTRHGVQESRDRAGER